MAFLLETSMPEGPLSAPNTSFLLFSSVSDGARAVEDKAGRRVGIAEVFAFDGFEGAQVEAADVGHDTRLARRYAPLRKQKQQTGEKYIDSPGVAEAGEISGEGENDVGVLDALVAVGEVFVAETDGGVGGVEAAATSLKGAMAATNGSVGAGRVSGLLVHDRPQFEIYFHRNRGTYPRFLQKSADRVDSRGVEGRQCVAKSEKSLQGKEKNRVSGER
jgi:hypothetical protein